MLPWAVPTKIISLFPTGSPDHALGIAGDEMCMAARALERLGVPTTQLVLSIELQWLPEWLARPPVPTRRDPWRDHLGRFSGDVRQVLRRAKEHAAAGPPYILALEQLLGALLDDGDGPAARIIHEAGADVGEARGRAEALAATTGTRLPGRQGQPERLDILPRVLHAIRGSAGEARRHGEALVRMEHLLLGLIRAADRTDAWILKRAARASEPAADEVGILTLIGIDPDRLQDVIEQRLG